MKIDAFKWKLSPLPAIKSINSCIHTHLLLPPVRWRWYSSFCTKVILPCVPSYWLHCLHLTSSTSFSIGVFPIMFKHAWYPLLTSCHLSAINTCCFPFLTSYSLSNLFQSILNFHQYIIIDITKSMNFLLLYLMEILLPLRQFPTQ